MGYINVENKIWSNFDTFWTIYDVLDVGILKILNFYNNGINVKLMIEILNITLSYKQHIFIESNNSIIASSINNNTTNNTVPSTATITEPTFLILISHNSWYFINLRTKSCFQKIRIFIKNKHYKQILKIKIQTTYGQFVKMFLKNKGSIK